MGLGKFFTMLLLLSVSILFMGFRVSAQELDFHEIFENHGTIMLITNIETGEIRYANQKAIDFYGHANLVGMSIDDISTLSPEEHYEQRKQAELGEKNHFINEHLLASGNIRTVETRCYMIDYDGEPHLYSIIVDVTAAHQIEQRNRILVGFLFVFLLLFSGGATYFLINRQNLHQKIRQHKSVLDKTINNANMGTWRIDSHDEVLYADANWQNIDELSLDGTMALSDFYALVHLDDRKRLESAIGLLLDGTRNNFEEEFRFRQASVWILMKGALEEQGTDEKKMISGIILDITEKKQGSLNSRHMHNLLNYIVKHNNAAVAVHDLDLNYVYVSDQYLIQFNVEKRDIIGKHHYEVFPDLPEKWREIHLKTLKGEVHKGDRDPFRRADGTIDWTRWETRPWYDEKGNIAGIIVYTEVINDQIEKEEELKIKSTNLHSQKQALNATLNAIGDAVIATDEKGNITTFNPTSEMVTGYSKDDCLGEPFDMVFAIKHAHTGELVESPVKRVLATKTRVNLEADTVLIDKHGNERYIEDSATPIYDKDRRVLGVVVVFRDVTETVKLNQSLRTEKQRLKHLIDSTADIIFEIDSDLRYVFITGHGLNSVKLSSEELTGKTPTEALGKHGKQRESLYQKALDGEMVSFEWTYNDQDETFYFDTSVSPITDDQGTITGAVGISRNITEKRLKQQEIEYLSYHDHLTGLYNRRYLYDKLIEIDTETFYPLALIMIDLNGLKILNDAYGHALGDEALMKVASVLKKTATEDDIVTRIGGDEFIVILHNTTEEAVEERKKHILEYLELETVENAKLSVAIGHQLKNSNDVSIGDVMKEAEDMMYFRKLSEGKSARNQTIRAILKTLTDKYEEERVHSERVGQLCKQMGEALNLANEAQDALMMAGMFHDIGKISVPDEILGKPHHLSTEEFQTIKNHTDNGYQILRAADQYSDLAVHALYHHERIDGKGYPKGLKANEIPYYSRIISICDAFEAMTSDRPYRKAMNPDEAIKELKKHAGTQFDADLVDVFVRNYSDENQI